MNTTTSNTPESIRTSQWRETYHVHPVADIFPMLDDTELDELAEDIRQNGLRQSIVLWRDEAGREFLLDGRNRLEAMERAGIPLDDRHVVVTTECSDPATFVISLNIRRRHLTAADRARLVIEAIAAGHTTVDAETVKHLAVSRGGRGNTSPATRVAELAQVSKPTALEQLAVKADPELDAQVQARDLTPQEAAHIIRQRKKTPPRRMTSEEKQARRDERCDQKLAAERSARNEEKRRIVAVGTRISFVIELAIDTKELDTDFDIAPPSNGSSDQFAEMVRDELELLATGVAVVSVNRADATTMTTAGRRSMTAVVADTTENAHQNVESLSCPM